MAILVTGGAGYIGSHATLILLQAGFDVVAIDNLCNASATSLKRVAQLVGRTASFIKGDICDRMLLDQLLTQYSVQAVLHFAGLKSVVSSTMNPLSYYKNNLSTTINLCQAMDAAGVYTLIFSSSATVYGNPIRTPIVETHPVGQVTNPYGRSKFMVEQVLIDLASSDNRWKIGLLRYFNPVGAHASGLIGEDPNGIPNNLLPYISQVAMGKLPELMIFGKDYPTSDGTGIRDYIHVMDLAEGHLAALKALSAPQNFPGVNVWNLGSGCGYSVLQMVQAFETVSGRKVPYRFAPRRTGDIAISYADTSKAARELGWSAKRSLDDMINDTWRWNKNNPDGYPSD